MTATTENIQIPQEDPREDQKLVEDFQNGDESAFVVLVERYKHRLFRIALSVVRSHDDAEDVLQDALVKVYHGLNSFRSASKVYTWLYRIVMNKAIDYVRKRPHVAFEPQEEMLYELPDQRHDKQPDHAALSNELNDAIFAAIDDLPEKQRRVILLREVEDLSYGEIADIVGCSEGTVMSRLYYARERVREALTPYLENRT